MKEGIAGPRAGLKIPRSEVVRKGFAGRLRETRVAAGYQTMAEFARELGVEHERYRSWETGRTEPSIYHLFMILALTKVSADYLVTGRRPGRPAETAHGHLGS